MSERDVHGKDHRQWRDPRKWRRRGADSSHAHETTRHQPRVDIGMFSPDNLLAREDLLARYFGPAGTQVVREARSGVDLFDLSPRAVTAANNHFFKEMRRTFHLPERTDPVEFYRTSMRAANDAISAFNTAIFPLEARTIGALNEITAFDDSPATALFYLSSPDVDPRLQFEVARQLALGEVAGAIEARARNSGFARELARMQQLFNKHLFEGKIGQGRRVDVFSWHDNDTNDVLELADTQRAHIIYDRSDPKHPIPRNVNSVHIKETPQHMRTVADVGDVLADLNTKDVGSAINKAIRKAAKNKKDGGSGVIDIDVAVHDTIRGKMVVGGTDSIDEPRIDALIDKVTDIVTTASENGKIGKLDYITRDDEKNDEAKKIRFKRLQIKFTHVPVPIEIIFYDQKSSFQEELHVGSLETEGPNAGHYNGYAHSLYDVLRLRELIEIYYPRHVFDPKTNVNGNGKGKNFLPEYDEIYYLLGAVNTREYDLANSLRTARRVQPLTREAWEWKRRRFSPYEAV